MKNLEQLDFQLANEPPANELSPAELAAYERWMDEEEARFLRAYQAAQKVGEA